MSRATWVFTKKLLEPIVKAKNDKLLDEINLLKQVWNLPNKILLIEGDNELLIDLNSEISIRVFIEEIKNKAIVNIEEFLFDENNSIVTNMESECFTNQIIAVFNNQEKKHTNIILPNKNNRKPENNIQRTFSIGSEWFYLKIYCGVAIADEILCTPLFLVAQQLLKQGTIDEWFFIRYNDPKNHIRIRFHVSDFKNIGNIINLVHKYLGEYVKNELIYKIQVDTYHREIERYKKELIVVSEKIFFHDSLTTILFLKKLDSWVSDYRWLYGFYSIDNMLNVFGFDLKEKIALMEHLKIAFEKEHNLEKNGRSHINTTFGKFEFEIEQAFKKSESSEIEIVKKCAFEKSKRISQYVLEIKSSCNRDELNDLLASYIHMLLNRLFKSKQRLYELVIYTFLYKAYQKNHFSLK